MNTNLAFISYRREDEGSATRFLKDYLDKIFGSDQIFMDVEDIRVGKKWNEVIEENLGKASTLIVVIGKSWLRLQDEFFRRRIDSEHDWVRKEIETSINRGINIIPICIGVDAPKPEALPPSIKTLTNVQALTLTAVNFREALKDLISLLEKNGFQKNIESGKYPVIPPEDKIGKYFPLAYTDEEIFNELKKIPEWDIVKYEEEDTSSEGKGIAIERTYEFKKFDDAINFIYKTSKHISEKQHHPEWENIWRTLRVRFTTWDIGHKVSYLDIELAQYLDGEFKKYQEEIREKIESTI